MGGIFGQIGDAGIPIISDIASGLGEGLGIMSGQTAMKMSEDQFNKSMDWEKKKFYTAHQAEMEDLKAAGLNPVLTAMGGQGNSAGNVSPTASFNGSGSQLIQLITSIAPAIAQLKTANAQETTANAVAGKYGAEKEYFEAQKSMADIEKLIKQQDLHYYEKKFNYDKSKSPLWLFEKIEDLFKEGQQTYTAQEAEKFGEKLFDFENNFKYLNYLTPQKQLSLIAKVLFRLLSTN